MKIDVYCATIRVVVADEGEPDLFEMIAHLEEFADRDGWHLPYWQTKTGVSYIDGREYSTSIVLLTPDSLHGLKLRDLSQREVRVLHARLLSGDELDLQRKAGGEFFPWERRADLARMSTSDDRGIV